MLKKNWPIALLSALTFLSGCNRDYDIVAAEYPSINARSLTVQNKQLPSGTVVPGTIVSDRRLDISSRVVGVIEKLDIRAGQHINKGDLLVQIDSDDVDESIRQAREAVIQAEEKLTDAVTDREKYEKLSAKGFVSSENLRKAKMQERVYTAAKAQAEAALSAAKAQRKYTEVRSPVSGVVVNVNLYSGELATAGTPILTIESRELLLFKIFVSESTMGMIHEGSQIDVRLDALEDQKIEGRVRGVVPSGDKVTRRYEVDIALPPDDRLVPGMFGRAAIPNGHETAIMIPKSALTHKAGLTGVYTISAENKVAFRWIRTGIEEDGMVEIVAGLEAGEIILRSPEANLIDGTTVTLIEG